MKPLTSIPGIGPATLQKLNKLGVIETRDLLFHLPTKYFDFRQISPIRSIRFGDSATVKGKVINADNVYTKKGKNLQIITLTDHSGTLNLIWMNQPYLVKNFQIGQEIIAAGVVRFYQKRLTIFFPYTGDSDSTRLVAVYPETKGLTSKWLRRFFLKHLKSLSSEMDDPLPQSLLSKHELLSLPTALNLVHLPTSPEDISQSQLRLALEQLLPYQLSSALEHAKIKKISCKNTLSLGAVFQKDLDNFISSIPFKLTSSQLEVWQEIQSDLLNTTPTNRLIQGDVGSGKTILAILAAKLTCLNKFQTIIMVPTEILAQQHFQTFSKFLDTKHHIALNTGSHRLTTNEVSACDILITTQAVTYKNANDFTRTALVVIDEQHKFGVNQRGFLSQLPTHPHTLTMTATPIPRSFSLSLLGFLSYSHMQGLPQNRLPIKTFMVSPDKQPQGYDWIRTEIKSKKIQAFFVCPLIDPSDKLAEVENVTDKYNELQSIYPELKIAVVHGQTKQSEKDVIMADFSKGRIDILVTTPIIEVGIDFPNANIIVIYSPDRFGLAQLHQLRGRVGRGSQQAYCCLFTDPSLSAKSSKRLEYFSSHPGGFDIAEYDYQHRGPGSIFSVIQHGFPDEKLHLLDNQQIMSISQDISQSLVTNHPEVVSQYTQNLAATKLVRN